MANPSNPTPAMLARWAIPGGPTPEVWLLAAPPTSGRLTTQMAEMLLNTHTQPGDLILDIDDDIALAATAAGMHRRHHTPRGNLHVATRADTGGYANLVFLHWPGARANPRPLLVDCGAMLSDHGMLVIAVAVATPHRLAHLTALAGAAHATHLRTRRHITAVDPSRPALTYVGTSAGQVEPTAWPHTDLLVLTAAGTAR